MSVYYSDKIYINNPVQPLYLDYLGGSRFWWHAGIMAYIAQRQTGSVFAGFYFYFCNAFNTHTHTYKYITYIHFVSCWPRNIRWPHCPGVFVCVSSMGKVCGAVSKQPSKCARLTFETAAFINTSYIFLAFKIPRGFSGGILYAR